VSENAGELASLWSLVDDVSASPGVRHEFLTDRDFLYDEDERRDGVRLPARLFNDLDAETAQRLAEEFRGRGLAVTLFEPERVARAMWMTLAAGAASVGLLGLTVCAALYFTWTIAMTAGLAFGASVIGAAVIAAQAQSASADRHRTALARLRPAPVALPSSDPWVRRLAELLRGAVPYDARPVVATMATLVQRLVDHRVTLAGADAKALELAVAPVQALLPLIESHVERLHELDTQLASLEEGQLVRAIASAAARGRKDERAALLQALDRLRGLEELRARTMHGLLEAASLLRRAVTAGLSIHDETAAHERHVRMALAALGADEEPGSVPTTRTPATPPEQAT